MDDVFRHCQRLVREADKDRFLTALFAPAARRNALFALYAFNVEVTRVRERAHEPLPGEIRLQWWSEVLAGEREGEAVANPVASALLQTVSECGLSAPMLAELVIAHQFDLYDQPMADVAALEDYAAKTSAVLMAQAVQILRPGSGAEPAIAPLVRGAGIAYALTGVMRALALHASRRQLYLPLDLLKHWGVDPESLFRLRATPALGAALSDLRGVARNHLATARRLVDDIPVEIGPAILPAALVEPELRHLQRAPDPFRVPPLPRWRRQWTLWRAARGNRVRL
jgi:phytoene synthase